jgi:hypothetical protein
LDFVCVSHAKTPFTIQVFLKVFKKINIKQLVNVEKGPYSFTAPQFSNTVFSTKTI